MEHSNQGDIDLGVEEDSLRVVYALKGTTGLASAAMISPPPGSSSTGNNENQPSNDFAASASRAPPSALRFSDVSAFRAIDSPLRADDLNSRPSFAATPFHSRNAANKSKNNSNDDVNDKNRSMEDCDAAASDDAGADVARINYNDVPSPEQYRWFPGGNSASLINGPSTTSPDVLDIISSIVTQQQEQQLGSEPDASYHRFDVGIGPLLDDAATAITGATRVSNDIDDNIDATQLTVLNSLKSSEEPDISGLPSRSKATAAAAGVSAVSQHASSSFSASASLISNSNNAFSASNIPGGGGGQITSPHNSASQILLGGLSSDGVFGDNYYNNQEVDHFNMRSSDTGLSAVPSSVHSSLAISEVAQQMRSSGELRAGQPEFIPGHLRTDSFHSRVNPIHSTSSSVATSASAAELTGISSYLEQPPQQQQPTSTVPSEPPGLGLSQRQYRYQNQNQNQQFGGATLISSTSSGLRVDMSGPEFNFSELKQSIYELTALEYMQQSKAQHGRSNNTSDGNDVLQKQHQQQQQQLMPYEGSNNDPKSKQAAIGIAHIPSPVDPTRSGNPNSNPPSLFSLLRQQDMSKSQVQVQHQQEFDGGASLSDLGTLASSWPANTNINSSSQSTATDTTGGIKQTLNAGEFSAPWNHQAPLFQYLDPQLLNQQATSQHVQLQQRQIEQQQRQIEQQQRQIELQQRQLEAQQRQYSSSSMTTKATDQNDKTGTAVGQHQEPNGLSAAPQITPRFPNRYYNPQRQQQEEQSEEEQTLPPPPQQQQQQEVEAFPFPGVSGNDNTPPLAPPRLDTGYEPILPTTRKANKKPVPTNYDSDIVSVESDGKSVKSNNNSINNNSINNNNNSKKGNKKTQQKAAVDVDDRLSKDSITSLRSTQENYPVSSAPPAGVGNGTSSSNTNSSSSSSSGTSSSKGIVIAGAPARVELVESPRSKAAYKEFFKEFRRVEKDDGEAAAKEYAIRSLKTLPENAKWRVYLDLADLAKRNNLVQEARLYYAEVCGLQPRAGMGWLEWSKMEEENGQLLRSLNILVLGLKVCRINEALLTRVIRLHEKLHKPGAVRGMLSALRGQHIDKIWKSVLEGTLFEARAGNIPIARKLFRYLMHTVQWYGPIYYEAFRLEEKEGNDVLALGVINRGLRELPRYGPLWFGLMRLMERDDVRLEQRRWQRGFAPVLTNLVAETNRAVRLISKELVWKVHFELSQAFERAAEIAALSRHQVTNLPLKECRATMLVPAKQQLIRSLLVCPANLRWRVLLVGARLEIGIDQIEKARMMLRRAFLEAPLKSKSSVYLECSRLEEFCGNFDIARSILRRARFEVRSEWKVYLESVLLEVRCGKIAAAIAMAADAVENHPGTGRLWSIYIQLYHRIEYLQFKQAHHKDVNNNSSSVQRLPAVTSPESKHLNEAKNSSTTTAVMHGTNASLFTTPARYSLLPAIARDASQNEAAAVADSGLNGIFALTKTDIVKLAIKEVPKSGEVWCERARCHLNPLNVESFDLCEAQRSLRFAIQFTPQYGDTFVEYARLEMLSQVLLPRVLHALQLPVQPFVETFMMQVDPLADSSVAVRDGAFRAMDDEILGTSFPTTGIVRQQRRQAILAIEKLEMDFGSLRHQYNNIKIYELQRRCLNADPNYGSAWFYARRQPYNIPSSVLNSVQQTLAQELCAAQKIYARAIFHYIRRSLLSQSSSSSSSLSSSLSNQQHGVLRARETELVADISLANDMLLNWPRFGVYGHIPFVSVDDGVVFTSSDFITGLVEMNRTAFSRVLPEEVKRKALFGSDQIVS